VEGDRIVLAIGRLCFWLGSGDVAGSAINSITAEKT
jgi:hypothetical protein